MNRRFVLGSVALAAVAAIAGCNSSSGPSQPTALQTNVSLIANGLSGLIAVLHGLPAGTIPPDVLTRAQTIVDDVKTNAATIAQALTPNPDTVQAISSAVSALSALLAPFFPVAPAVGAIVQAALVLVPIILAFVGRSAPAAATAAPRMTPAEARGVLAGASPK